MSMLYKFAVGAGALAFALSPGLLLEIPVFKDGKVSKLIGFNTMQTNYVAMVVHAIVLSLVSFALFKYLEGMERNKSIAADPLGNGSYRSSASFYKAPVNSNITNDSYVKNLQNYIRGQSSPSSSSSASERRSYVIG